MSMTKITFHNKDIFKMTNWYSQNRQKKNEKFSIVCLSFNCMFTKFDFGEQSEVEKGT